MGCGVVCGEVGGGVMWCNDEIYREKFQREILRYARIRCTGDALCVLLCNGAMI